MNWRDNLIYAFVTLFVTVVAGIIVWYLTKGPDTEKLLYSFENVATVASEKGPLSLSILKVMNIGGTAAQDVSIVVPTDSLGELVEKQVTISSGPATKFTVSQPQDNQILISMPSLAPTEELTATLLTRGFGSTSPAISIRSLSTFGSEVPDIESSGIRRGLTASTIVKLLVIAIAGQALLFLGIKVLKRRDD